jgi:hypothetical protein
MPQTLNQLLRDADALHPPVADNSDLVRRVRRRQARHVIVRRTFAAAAVVMISVVLLMRSTKPTTRIETIMKVISVPVPAPSLSDLDNIAALHELTAQKLAVSRSPARSRPLAAIAPEANIRFQRDRAALVIVYEADRFVRQNRPKQAIASYRRAIELFPQSHWAEIARERLRQMQT